MRLDRILHVLRFAVKIFNTQQANGYIFLFCEAMTRKSLNKKASNDIRFIFIHLIKNSKVAFVCVNNNNQKSVPKDKFILKFKMISNFREAE